MYVFVFEYHNISCVSIYETVVHDAWTRRFDQTMPPPAELVAHAARITQMTFFGADARPARIGHHYFTVKATPQPTLP